VHLVDRLVVIHAQAERAVGRIDRLVDDTLDELLVLGAVADEVRDRAELEPVAIGELLEVAHARHRAVGIHDLADDRRGREPGELGEVAARLRVPRAHEHAAVLRHHRKDVPRLHDVLGLRVACRRRTHRTRPVGGRNARGDARGGFDRDGECRAQGRAVVAHHERQGELPAALLGEREADEAARVRGHEVDRFGRDKIGGEHHIAFVFAVLGVGQHDHLAEADVVDEFLAAAHGHVGRGTVEEDRYFATTRVLDFNVQ
jgi:hypothetical protein